MTRSEPAGLPGRTSRHGFTLLELLVALALVGLIGAWLVRFVGAQQRAYARQGEIVAATQNARAVADIMLAEARNAGLDPRGAAGARVTHAEPDSFGWSADLNADGDADDFGPDGDERVLYYYDARGGRLIRRANGRDVVMAEELDALRFTYMDRSGRAVSGPASVAAFEALIRFTTLGGEFAASIPVATRLPNLAR